MKTLIAALVLSLSPFAAYAAGEQQDLEKAYVNLSDRASLQRGAQLFVNYCLSCHSAAYMRYNRLASDLGLSEDLVKENLMFTTEKIGEHMKATMREEDAEAWFGVAPPDLSVTARSRKPDWIYTYLKSFYEDDSTVTGWNNTIFPNVAMPHVLYTLQGTPSAVIEEHNGNKEVTALELKSPGKLTPVEYDRVARDITNFMVYLAEPAKLVRYQVGFWVMVFLGVFIFVSYLLKKEYWRDVH